MVARVFCTLLIVLASLANTANAQDKVRVCHFASHDVQLLSIARSALKAHLAHGDVEAPPSIRTAADCLIPQPPPQPVAATGTTDANGSASFLIPGTNVIARLHVADESGSPVSGAAVELLVAGSDYFAIAVDESHGHAPAFHEGSLSEARPGSALQLVVNLVMKAFTATFPTGSILQTTGSLPNFVRSHFTTSENCFTEDDLRVFLNDDCIAMTSAARMMLAAYHVGSGLFRLAIGYPTVIGCDWLASTSAADVHAGKILPVKLRMYHPFPGVTRFPIYLEDLGPCGGSCCVANGTQCELTTSASRCTGTYNDLVPCTNLPCKTGACCDPTTGCSILSELQCLALGRTYKGDGTTCFPDPCIGACCNPQTGCTAMPKFLCASLNGTYHGDGTSCTRIPGTTTLRYTVQSSKYTGGVSIPIPFTHGEIKTTVTIPGNSSGNQCDRNWRVEIFVFPFGAGRSGGYWEAGQQFSICHTATEVITFTQLNPGTPCSTYYVNAITGSTSTIEVEIRP